MSNLYRDVKACCPFYQTQKKEKSGAMYIKCEKIISKGCIVLRFPSVQKGDKWLNTYCNSISGCKNCEMYQLINQKYEK
mgnify:FL=1